jgi:predicted 3-demethylubiquinone-9 3-methyltransferase (glyoxalase superfamily)
VQKITTFLWFDQDAEEAATFYTSLFDESKVLSVARDHVGATGAKGKVLQVTFQLAGQQFMALNGGPEFKFNEAISLFVLCETQAEVDRLWEALTANGGEESRCGWLKDRFGLSWQIVPRAFGEMMESDDHEAAGRAMNAMLGMNKLDLAELERAYQGR